VRLVRQPRAVPTGLSLVQSTPIDGIFSADSTFLADHEKTQLAKLIGHFADCCAQAVCLRAIPKLFDALRQDIPIGVLTDDPFCLELRSSSIPDGIEAIGRAQRRVATSSW